MNFQGLPTTTQGWLDRFSEASLEKKAEVAFYWSVMLMDHRYSQEFWRFTIRSPNTAMQVFIAVFDVLAKDLDALALLEYFREIAQEAFEYLGEELHYFFLVHRVERRPLENAVFRRRRRAGFVHRPSPLSQVETVDQD